MSIELSKLKASILRSADSLKAITIVAAIACCTLAPQTAQAQNINLGPVNINLGNTGSTANTNSQLPPTNLDSFVYQAGGQAAMIYGDESTSLPPLFGFTQASRINAGITGVDAAGLTTGHGSYMPCAWGADEFLAPPGEWCTTGSGTGGQSVQASALDAADLLEQSIGMGTNLFTLTTPSNGGTGLSSLSSFFGGSGSSVGIGISPGGVTIGGSTSTGIPGVSVGGSASFGF